MATRTIRINDDAGTDALVGLRAQEAAPQINRPYQIDIISKTGQPIDTAEVSLKLYETYLDKVAVTPGSGYSANFEKDAQNKLIKISISKTAEDVERNEVLAKVSINIPGEASSNENLVFSIPSGRYEEAGGAATFSVAEQSRPLTRMRSACQQGDHSFKDESQYILATDQITCALCGTPISAATSGYTGVLSTRDGMGRVMISAGSLKKNEWFALGEDICHAGEDGILHETETKDNRDRIPYSIVTLLYYEMFV